MLSVGNSLMWGQGLRPENRFREIVRSRLTQEADPVVELSMARSGAKLHPANNPNVDNFDITISNSLDNPPIDPIYAASGFTREVPHPSLTSIRQLVDAEKILTNAAPEAGPEDIRWILLDGGINDVGIEGILAPFEAYNDGYFLSGWSSWILDQAKVVQKEMEETLHEAMSLFPNAVIVVNGYFPIFSYHSIGSLTKIQSVGLLHGISNLVLTNPIGLDALASASTAWFAASNTHLRRAIRNVLNEHPNRTILFARSQIEGSHTLFSPDTWLWGYDAIPDDIPDTLDHWVQWLAGATPEDEVIQERIDRCNVLAQGAGEAIPCRLASIGHPNIAGAHDYARSIIEALEDAGVISSDLHECSLLWRRRQKACLDFYDSWAYKCVSIDATIGKSCDGAIRGVGSAALDQFSEAGDHLGQSGAHLRDAAECFDNAVGNMASAASNQLSEAGDHLDQASDHLDDAVECWDQTALDMQQCDDTEASEIAACNAAYTQRVNGPCDIRCNSFRNCNGRYGRYDPRRYTCRTARAACVAAAAIARSTCRAGALAAREACKALAWGKSAACKAGVVLGNTICSTGEVAGAIGDSAIALGHRLVVVGAAIAVFSGDTLCAIGNVGRAGLDLGLTILHGAAGIGLGIVTAGTFIGCAFGRWFVNRSCRIGNWVTNKICNIGSIVLSGFCWITAPIRFLTRRSTK